MEISYQIGAFSFRILCPDEIHPPENLALFRADTGKVDYTYQIKISDQFLECKGTMLTHWQDLTVFQTDTEACRLLDLLDALCDAVPVYHLGCTISEDAVNCLEQALY